jgi:hypothetical protein
VDQSRRLESVVGAFSLESGRSDAVQFYINLLHEGFFR